MNALTSTIGSRGTLTLPKKIRERFGLREGSLVIVEEQGEAIVIRPAVALPREVEAYSPERRAEFLLNNAASAQDYEWAREEVRRMGLDPEKIEHKRPG